MANEQLQLLADGRVELEFKRPWKDETRSIGLAPKALLARLSAIKDSDFGGEFQAQGLEIG